MNNIVTKVVFLIILTFNLSIVFSQVPGKPANSYVSGQNWYCVDGFKKSGNECISIFSSELIVQNQKPKNSKVVEDIPVTAVQSSEKVQKTVIVKKQNNTSNTAISGGLPPIRQ